jgi:hypothetical protein
MPSATRTRSPTVCTPCPFVVLHGLQLVFERGYAFALRQNEFRLPRIALGEH